MRPACFDVDFQFYHLFAGTQSNVIAFLHLPVLHQVCCMTFPDVMPILTCLFVLNNLCLTHWNDTSKTWLSLKGWGPIIQMIHLKLNILFNWATSVPQRTLLQTKLIFPQNGGEVSQRVVWFLMGSSLSLCWFCPFLMVVIRERENNQNRPMRQNILIPDLLLSFSARNTTTTRLHLLLLQTVLYIWNIKTTSLLHKDISWSIRTGVVII